jgi:hypothetical protein
MVVSTIGTPCGCTRFRETFFALVRLGFAERFFDAGLAVERFAAFPRAGLEALRDLPRTVDRLLLDVACFFRRAIVAAYAVGLRRIPVQYWPNFEESKPACRSPCRSLFLRRYFGEEHPPRCGTCDRCRAIRAAATRAYRPVAREPFWKSEAQP